MAARRYTLITYTDPKAEWVIHKPGCSSIREDMQYAGAQKQLVGVDLEGSDEEVLEAIDAYLGMTMDDVHLCACTGYVADPPLPDPQPKQVHAAAEASRKAAAERLQREVEEIIDKLVAARGEDNVGVGGDEAWDAERLPACKDDYVYDLAVEVRMLRAKGEPWWRVGYELNLPGAGASNKQGRKGGAFARRLWRAAWGKTYVEDGTVIKRESKLTREARAMENEGRPFFSEGDEDHRVVEVVRGQMIHWVTRLGGTHGMICSAQETYVHDDPKFIRVKQGPQGRYLEFYEQLDPSMLLANPRKSITRSGPLRAVYVDRITRVGV